MSAENRAKIRLAATEKIAREVAQEVWDKTAGRGQSHDYRIALNAAREAVLRAWGYDNEGNRA